MTHELVTNDTQQTCDAQDSLLDHSILIMVIHQISQTTKAEDALHFTAVGPKNGFKNKISDKAFIDDFANHCHVQHQRMPSFAAPSQW